MLSTATPVSEYQLIRRLLAVLRTSKNTSPRRGSGAGSVVDMEPIVTLIYRTCPPNCPLTRQRVTSHSVTVTSGAASGGAPGAANGYQVPGGKQRCPRGEKFLKGACAQGAQMT
jgi:hypothetical protein